MYLPTANIVRSDMIKPAHRIEHIQATNEHRNNI